MGVQLQRGGNPIPPYDAPGIRGSNLITDQQLDRLAERFAAGVTTAIREALQTTILPVNSLSIGLTAADVTDKPAMPAQNKVRTYLNQNPSAVALSSRKLSAIVGVNHETVSQVLREWRNR